MFHYKVLSCVVLESGEEYGIEFDNEQKALGFRKLIFSALLETATPVVEVECAIAEYDTKNREFIILSKSSVCRISQRPSDDEAFFTIEDQSDSTFKRIFVDNLTRDIQMWPSIQTNQITFWGAHHQVAGINKSMFLLEMDPQRVGASCIEKFFRFLSEILQDRSFVKEDEIVPMEDDDFDLGPLGGIPSDTLIIINFIIR